MILEKQSQNPFGVTLTGRNDNLDWGSNGFVLNSALQLLFAYSLTSESKYKVGAQKAMDYILGQNPVGTSYVTGLGQVSPHQVHFRPTMSRRIAMPAGLLAGGPNNVDIGGDVPLASIWNKAPFLHYADHHRSWATNEVTIYWNAALASVATILSSIAK